MQVPRFLVLILVILAFAQVNAERLRRPRVNRRARPRTGFPTKAPTSPSTKFIPTPITTNRPTLQPTNPPTNAATTTTTTSSNSFKIDIVFQGSVSDAHQSAFLKAAARLQNVIDQDFATELPVWAGTYCGYTFPDNTVIDDVLIAVKISDIDGPGGILGQAGPCLLSGRGTSAKSRFGVMQFDLADVNSMSTSTFEGVAMHEMVHVLGLGTLWESGFRNLIAGTSTPLTYLGAEGNIGHREIGGTGPSAIVEDVGGRGTARGHFKEATYGNELMTGWASSSMPMSKLTVRALRDLGFSTDVSRADPFSISSGRRLRGKENKQPLVNDILDYKLTTMKSRPKKGRKSDEDD
jgi:hypothetical protein